MKTLLTILLISLSQFVNAQAGWAWGFGASSDPLLKFDAVYRVKDHQFTGTYMPVVVYIKPFVKEDVFSFTYGKVFKDVQPYVGWSNSGLAFGINKYLDNGIAGIGITGDYVHVTFSAGNLIAAKNKGINGNDWAIIGLQLVSGFSNGLHEAIQARHWGSGLFWDNSISWKNKYKDWDGGDHRAKFPGSKTVLVGFTDGYHLTNLISNAANIGTLAVALGGKEKKDLKTIAKKVLISVVANRAAYYVAYYKTFK